MEEFFQSGGKIVMHKKKPVHKKCSTTRKCKCGCGCTTKKCKCVQYCKCTLCNKNKKMQKTNSLLTKLLKALKLK